MRGKGERGKREEGKGGGAFSRGKDKGREKRNGSQWFCVSHISEWP